MSSQTLAILCRFFELYCREWSIFVLKLQFCLLIYSSCFNKKNKHRAKYFWLNNQHRLKKIIPFNSSPDHAKVSQSRAILSNIQKSKKNLDFSASGDQFQKTVGNIIYIAVKQINSFIFLPYSELKIVRKKPKLSKDHLHRKSKEKPVAE